MAWYLKHRPQTVAQLAITPVRQHMEQVLKSGRYAHAYLFTGPKGVGKTSTARILARVLNDPINAENVKTAKGPLQEPNPRDALLAQIAQGRSQVVIEQDAASHRGIDDIRALQEYVSVVPTEGLVRVVILDEAHMLTNEAFNALLKLLEEPPQRVVFVLATTEPNKIPPTITSRCEQIQFRQATSEEIEKVLQDVAKQEKLKLSKEIIAQIAQVAQGSFRDAIKYLESVVNQGQVDEQLLASLLGEQNSAVVLLKALATKQAVEVAGFFEQARSQGRNLAVLEQQLFYQLQQRLHRAIERGEKEQTILNIINLLDYLLSQISDYEPIEGLQLELACLGWCFEGKDNNPTDQAEPAPVKKKLTSAKPIAKPTSKFVTSKKKSLKTESKNESETKIDSVKSLAAAQFSASTASSDSSEAVSPLTRVAVQQKWEELLLFIRTQSQALESLLRNSSLGLVEDNTLEITFELAFHQQQLESSKYRGLLEDVLRRKLHPDANFKTVLISAAVEKNSQSAATEDDQLLRAVEEAVLSVQERG